MGLTISHGAFEGAYSAFNRFRGFIARGIDGSFPPHENKELDPALWYFGDNYSEEEYPGIFTLLRHSDCDGTIEPETCGCLAKELEMLFPKFEQINETTVSSGHISAQGGYLEVTRRFIEGCKEAHENNEELLFW